MKRPGLSIAVLFVAAAVLFGATYFAVAAFVFWKPNVVAAAFEVAVLFSIGCALAIAGAKLWERWAPAFALILILAGVSSLQTAPHSSDPTKDALSKRTFSISGVVFVAAGAAVYLLNRRRSTGRLLP